MVNSFGGIETEYATFITNHPGAGPTDGLATMYILSVLRREPVERLITRFAADTAGGAPPPDGSGSLPPAGTYGGGSYPAYGGSSYFPPAGTYGGGSYPAYGGSSYFPPAGTYASEDFDCLRNGARCYMDHTKLEYSTQECRAARDFVAALMASRRILEQARQVANQRLPRGREIVILANNSAPGISGHGLASYGCHVNLYVEPDLLDALLRRRPHAFFDLYVTEAVAGILFTGQGKVTGDPDRPFLISQRAPFFEEAIGLQTTYRRPLINTRSDLRGRFHILGPHDSNLHEVANFLKVGSSQIAVAMLADGFAHPSLALRDPVAALQAINEDPSLTVRVELMDGRKWTALEILRESTAIMRRYVESSPDGRVPEAETILEVRERVLEQLAEEPLQLHTQLDWPAKLALLEKAGVDRTGPEAQYLDNRYADLSEQGLYNAIYAATGLGERVTTEERIVQLMRHAPEDTRAWFRAEMLQRFPQEVTADWDEVVSWHLWPRRTLSLDDDLQQFTRAGSEALLSSATSAQDVFDTLAPLRTWWSTGRNTDQKIREEKTHATATTTPCEFDPAGGGSGESTPGECPPGGYPGRSRPGRCDPGRPEIRELGCLGAGQPAEHGAVRRDGVME